MVESYRPANLKEAFKIRKETSAVPFAGGTDLMVRYKSWAGTLPAFTKPIMFVNHLSEMNYIEVKGSEMLVGSTATLTDIMEHEKCPRILKDAIRSIAAPALRNIGTMTGNICNASPAGDSICALYALGAAIVMSSEEGSRELPISEFITGPSRTVLNENEIVTAVKVPLRAESSSVFKKVGTRKANALSKLTISAQANVEGGKVTDIAIALGAVGPRIVRSTEIEARMKGMSVQELNSSLDTILKEYEPLITPIDDQRSTAAYRKRVALNLIKDFLSNIN